jgi:ketosteroid isomerase-like protein
MSQQDVEIVRNGYDAFNRKDIAAVPELYDPQIEWIEAGGRTFACWDLPRNPSIANEVFATVPQNFDDFHAEPEQLLSMS